MASITHRFLVPVSTVSARNAWHNYPLSDPKTTKMPVGGGTSRKIGWGCAARFLKPLPYFRPKRSCRQMMKKQLILLKNIPNSRLECNNHTPFQTEMVEIDTLFQTKTAEKNIPFGAAHTHISYIRDSARSGGECLVWLLTQARLKS